MELNKKTVKELKEICKENGIKGISSKSKKELINLLEEKQLVHKEPEIQIKRLNYIGSKYQLLDWLTESITKVTGYKSLVDKVIADLFSGTGIVSYNFRTLGSKVIANDSELYSSIITWAFTKSVYNSNVKGLIKNIQADIDSNKYEGCIGFITSNSSPYDSCERMFFTVENAKIIDYVRNQIELFKGKINEDEYKFLLASLLISADSVSNVPAVYGCYLKKFKEKAVKRFKLIPIHTVEQYSKNSEESIVYNLNVMSEDISNKVNADIVYLDPPYNERQYSKNYFPLNMIIKNSDIELKGKTGIPSDCFLSSFCRKGEVEDSFKGLIGGLKAKWIFISYNSESLITKERFIEILKEYGEVGVIERDYKRFKSFEYNESKEIKEYLFYVHKKI